MISGGNVSTIVRHVDVPILGNSLCNKFYSKLAPLAHLVISSDMMCAGYERGGRDACQVRICLSVPEFKVRTHT